MGPSVGAPSVSHDVTMNKDQMAASDDLIHEPDQAKAGSAAQIERLERELSQARLERETAYNWAKAVYDSLAWKLLSRLIRLVPKRFLRRSLAFATDAAALFRKQPGEAQPAEAGEAILVTGEVISAPAPSAGFDIFVFPIMDWETRTQRPQQLALKFAAQGQRVFYFRTTFIAGDHPRTTEVSPGIWVISLPMAKPVNIYEDSLDERLAQALADEIGKVQRSFAVESAISLVDLPFWYPAARRLREVYGWKIVYDCMDHHAGFSTNAAPALRTEDQLIRAADLVLATSHRLLQDVSRFNNNCLLVPNGADFEHFRLPPPEIPAELAGLPRPVIGYYGAIADWFDTRLVRDLALARPGWSFLLIGSTRQADLAPLRDVRNVYLLGEKPYRSLPAYLHRFDAAVIPFKKLPLTDATNPVKLYEYLSAGKPVVATRLDELSHYAGLIALAGSRDEWLDELERALRDTSDEVARQRVEFARQNTWDERIRVISGAITRLDPGGSSNETGANHG